jgi:hypothetical protein
VFGRFDAYGAFFQSCSPITFGNIGDGCRYPYRFALVGANKDYPGIRIGRAQNQLYMLGGEKPPTAESYLGTNCLLQIQAV